MSEAQEETKVRSRITVWSLTLGTSLAVAYFYLLLLLSALSSGRDLFSLSFHWLSVSLVVAAVLQYLWFRRVVPPEGVYTALVSQAGWAKSAALSSLPPTQRVAEGDLLMRRRALLVIASLGLLGVLLLGGGVALADTIDGTSGPDDLVGTDKDDVIHGSGGKDYISGLAAPDVLYGGAGNDTVVGRDGNDRIYGNTGSDMLFGEEGNDTINSAGDRQSDVVKCGQGDADRAYVDKIDRVKDNCETVFLLVRSEEPTS